MVTHVSQQWQSRPAEEISQMQRLSHMATTPAAEHLIRELPDTRATHSHLKTPVGTPQGAPEAGGTGQRDVCKQFRRTGKCSYGDKFKFEHQTPKLVMVLMASPMHEDRIEKLQDTLIELPGIAGTRCYDDPERLCLLPPSASRAGGGIPCNTRIRHPSGLV